MIKSIIEPLLRDHAKVRTLAGELKAHTERFDLPGMRHTSQRLIDVVRPHALKEEAVLYLIGMKFLKADNRKLPELFQEHDQTLARLYRLGQLMFSARLTNIEDQARQMIFVILEGLDHHFQEEESVVFPALDRLIDDEHKELILKRYGILDGGEFDELDRLPLLSLPDAMGGEAVVDNVERTSFGVGSIA
jgi:hemerythrin-like domain-containing protein